MKLMANREQIDKFLWDNYRKLLAPEYYFGVDNNQDTVEKFETAELRVLVTFLSTGKTRSVSNTFNALNELIHQKLGDKVFVDYCYFPEEANMEMMKANNIPYAFGNVSHAPVSDYDVMIISHSIMPEVFNIPHLLQNTGIPLTSEERMEDTDCPIIFYGGAASNESSITLGPIVRDGEVVGHSLVDICQYGYGEFIMDGLYEWINNWKQAGNDPKKDKKKMVEDMIEGKVYHDYLFYPSKYRFNYMENPQSKLDSFRLESITKLDDRLPDRVKYNRIENSTFKGFPLKVFNLDGENATSHDVMISSGCSGASSTCSFCMEATVAGNYYEREMDSIVEDMEFIKKTCAPNSLSYYSYNVNYYKHFMDLIKETSYRFQGLSLLNERLDVVANAPEQLALAKKVGLRRFSGAVEGMGDRIRNGILNKNLPRETLMKAVRNIYNLKLMHMKWGMILTGQENDDDIDTFISEVDEALAIRSELGANTSLQMNFTPLVFYSQIPLRWMPRITAKQSYTQERTMHRFITAMQERNVRTKFNGRGPGTYIEQLILDYGPKGTDWLVDVTLNEGMMYGRHFGEKDKVKVLKCLDARGMDHLFFIDERPLDWIFPSDHIITFTPKLLQMWKDRHSRLNFEASLCLNTLASQSPKCHACKICEPKHIPLMLKRDLTDRNTLDEVINSLSENRHADTSRVVVKLDPKWEFYSKTTLAHYITAQFLKNDEYLSDSFYAVGKNTTSWTAKDGQLGWFGGTFTFDIYWKTTVPTKLLTDLVSKINSTLKSCSVVGVYGNMKQLPITIQSDVSYIGQISDVSMSQIKDKMSDFNWEIKIASKSMGGQLDTITKHMPELKDRVLFVQSKDKILTYMSLPANINPHLVLSSILNKGYDKIIPIARFNMIDHGKEIDANCKCGNHLTYSFVKNDNQKLCQTCTGKLLLKKLVK